MADIFLKIVNMSISASWIVLAVFLLRLLLKKVPKWITVLLWGIVGLRLIMPFSLESVFSLIPSSETISKAPDSPRPYFESGVTIIDNRVNDYLHGLYFEGVTRPTGHFVDITTILAIVWLVGIVVLLAYTIISYFRVKNKIGTAVLLRDNIYQSENVVSPFVLSIIKPKIYLPFNINKQDMEHVIAHENAHIRRKDHLWKPFGFLVLTLHWFNPLMWLGYILLCRDIELACDEKVVKEFSNEQKADYSQALLTCSVNRRMIAACPLAFGEVGVRDRVKSVLNYKKPAFWITLAAVITSIILSVCFLTNPTKSKNNDLLLDVLHNDKTFISESGEFLYFLEYKPYGSLEIIPEKYTLIDLNGDGKDELVVHINPDVGEYMFFHVYKNKVYGYIFEERALISLKQDGTFVQSGGAGLNVYARLKFEKDKYHIVELAYIDDMTKQFRINDVVTTQEKANEFAQKFYNKPDVIWTEYGYKHSASNLKITAVWDEEKQMGTAITVTDKDTNRIVQKITLGENVMASMDDFYIADVNFDNEDDLIVPSQRPAAVAYYSAYVWDSSTEQYVYAPTFENLPNVSLDPDRQEILSSKSADKITSYAVSTFDEKTKDFKIQRTLYYYSEGQNMFYFEEHLKNGKMQTVRQFTKPFGENDDFYAMDSETENYYKNHVDWKLGSTKWENYLIKPYNSFDNALIIIKLIDQEHLSDYQNISQVHDTKAISHSWKIVVETTKDVTDFRFVELDESEKLKVGDTVFEFETLKANTPVLFHTYINDATLNRGISYQDSNGVVRYFGFKCDANDGTVSLSEINPEDF